MGIKRCLACGDPLPLNSRVPDQSYCSRPACQRERRKLWQRERRQLDPTYRENQAQAQTAWAQGHVDYWRRYRDQHPEYVDRNRAQQRARNAIQRSHQPIAKMDASPPSLPLPSGTYRMELKEAAGVAKMDAFTVEITVLTTA
jgi:hypothetical protein